MAIIIEEEVNKISIVRIVTWLAILAIVAIAVYYVFFVTPPFIEIAVPKEYDNIDQISKVNLKPNDVINGPDFRSLKTYITLPTPDHAGRPNPFLPF